MINIFIDESGIHKKIDHSSFVLVYIETNNIEKLEKSILKIEKELKIKSFHWSDTPWLDKEKFLSNALALDFKVKIAIVDNPVKPEAEMERILAHTIIEKNINCIFIDGAKPKWYERKVKLTLRNKGLSTRKLRTIKDEQCPGIRLADMTAGLARSYFDKKNPERFNKYYKKLEKKIIITLK